MVNAFATTRHWYSALLSGERVRGCSSGHLLGVMNDLHREVAALR